MTPRMLMLGLTTVVYLAGIGHSEREGTRLVAWFWGFFLMGRMLTAFLQHLRWLPLEAERWIVFIMVLGATVCLENAYCFSAPAMWPSKSTSSMKRAKRKR